MRIWYLCDLGAALQERGLEKTDAQILPKIILSERSNQQRTKTSTVAICAFFKFASQCLLIMIFHYSLQIENKKRVIEHGGFPFTICTCAFAQGNPSDL